MKPRKEHYRGNLPHYQQPGQWYSVTCSLEGAIPKSAMEKYALQLEIAKNNYHKEFGNSLPPGSRTSLSPAQDHGLPQVGGKNKEFGNSLSRAKKNYYVALRKYRLAFDKVLHNSKAPTIMLTAKNNRAVLEEALNFWEGKRLKNHAWCIMSNHFHWVLSVFEKDKNGNPVYLQDILHSVKLYSSRRINKNENRKGQLWMHESFETTIRDNSHFVRVVNYTINNPVSAKLVTEWQNWPGTFCEPDFPKTVGKTRS